MAQAVAVATVVSAVVGVATTLQQMSAQKAAAGDAKDIAEYNARQKELETEEQARRLEKEQSKAEATARARAYASGVDPESKTLLDVLEDQKKTHDEELDWLVKSGYSQAKAEKWRGQAESDRLSASATATLGKGVGDLFAGAGSIYSSGQQAKWWK